MPLSVWLLLRSKPVRCHPAGLFLLPVPGPFRAHARRRESVFVFPSTSPDPNRRAAGTPDPPRLSARITAAGVQHQLTVLFESVGISAESFCCCCYRRCMRFASNTPALPLPARSGLGLGGTDFHVDWFRRVGCAFSVLAPRLHRVIPSFARREPSPRPCLWAVCRSPRELTVRCNLRARWLRLLSSYDGPQRRLYPMPR